MPYFYSFPVNIYKFPGWKEHPASKMQHLAAATDASFSDESYKIHNSLWVLCIYHKEKCKIKTSLGNRAKRNFCGFFMDKIG